MPAILPALIFLVGSVLIPFLKGRVRQVYIVAVAVLGLVDVFLLKIQTSWVANYMGFEVVLLHADRISLFVGYIFVIIGFFAILYTIHVDEIWHHLLAFWYVGSALGAVFSGDLLSLYLWWEIMAVASAGFVFLNRTEEAKQAGYRYLLMHLIGGTIFIGGIFLHYMNTGSLALGPMEAGLAFTLVLIGVGMNAAFVLIHTWLPDAYPRALFTGSIFMSVFTTKTAAYALVRLAPGWDFVAYMGAIMAVYGVTFALIQSNPRKLLSYHIMSQLGYIVAGIGLGGALGLNGGLLHVFNNILYKSLLFMTIGVVIYRTGKDDLTQMGGVARKMPITTITAIIAALSIAGAPLFAGFISKAMIFKVAESNLLIELMLELAAVGTFLSFFKFIYFGFLRPNQENEAKVTEAPPHMIIPMVSVAALCIAVGVVPHFFTQFLPFALTAAESSFYVWPRIAGTLQIMAVSGVLYFLALSVFSPHKRQTFDFDWFYIQTGKGLQYVAEGFSWTNNAIENATGTLTPAIMSLRRPVRKINDVVTRLLFALFVDIWLFRPVTKSLAKENDAEPAEDLAEMEPEERALVDNLARFGEASSTIAGKVDSGVIDYTVGQFAKLGLVISEGAGLFDRYVIDGVVNGLGWLTQKTSARLRPMQTGDVQTYGLVMVGGAFFVLVFFGMVFYGIFRF